MNDKKELTPEERARAIKKLRMIGVLFILALMVNFCYQIWTHYFRHSKAPHIENCLLNQGPCMVDMHDGKTVTLTLTQVNHNHYQLEAKITKLEPTKVSVVIIAPHSDITSKQIMLTESKTKGVYTGEVILQDGTSDKNPWVALLVLESPPNNIAVPFKFNLDQNQ